MATAIQVSKDQLKRMDEAADGVIAGWSFAALTANLLPPPFDSMAVGSVFAKMGSRLAEVYEAKVSWSVLKAIGVAIAKGTGSVLAAGYVGTGLLKYIPGINIWVALLVQPPIVGAVAYSVGNTFKQYFRLQIMQGQHLTPEELKKLAETLLKERLG